MKTKLNLAVALCALMFTWNGRADETSGGKILRKINWSEVPAPKGTTPSKDRSIVIAEHAESKPVRFELLELENPGVHTKAHALRCQVRFSDVEGTGYLEMWNVFPPDEEGGKEMRAFSRTLGDAGPMAKLTGTGDWRPAILPFNSEGAKHDLRKLELNLFLPGKGHVEIKDVELVEFADPKEMFGVIERTAKEMLAPPAKPSALQPARQRGAWLVTGVSVAASATVVALVAWKKRRDSEQRRMKALDTM